MEIVQVLDRAKKGENEKFLQVQVDDLKKTNRVLQEQLGAKDRQIRKLRDLVTLNPQIQEKKDAEQTSASP